MAPLSFSFRSANAALLTLLLGAAVSFSGCLANGEPPDDDDDATAVDDDDDATANDDDSGAADDDDATEPPLFPVTVVATGLDGFYGRDVTLQLDGAQDLVADGDGTFVFGDGLAEGASYEVTIASAGSIAGCTLTAASGTLAVDALPEVGLACTPAEWVGPVDFYDWVDLAPLEEVQSIRSSSAGDGLVVSLKSPGGEHLLGEYDGAVWTWTDPLPAWASVAERSIEMNANGDILFLWVHTSGGLMVSHRQGGVWTHPADADDSIEPVGPGTPTRPSAAMNAQGDAVVIWDGSDGSARQVFLSEYSGGVWTYPADVSDNISVGGIRARYPQVALADSGDAAVVWQAEGDIYLSERRDGTWVHPTTTADAISAPSDYVAEVASVAMHSDGTTLVTWVQDYGPDLGERVAYLSEYRNGSWTHPSGVSDFVTPLGTTGAEEVVDPYVFFDGLGNGFLVWSGRGHVSISEHRNGSWTHPTSYENNIIPEAWRGPNPSYIMSWATNARGDVIVVWRNQLQSVSCDGGSLCHGLYRSEYRDGEWSHPQAETDTFSLVGDDENSWDSRIAATALASDGTGVTLFLSEDATTDCDGGPCNRAYSTVLQ